MVAASRVELGLTAAPTVRVATRGVGARVRCQEATVGGRVAMAAVVEGVGATKAAVDS